MRSFHASDCPMPSSSHSTWLCDRVTWMAAGIDGFADLGVIRSLNLYRLWRYRVEAGLFYFNAQNVKREVLERMHDHGAIDFIVLEVSTSANIDLAGGTGSLLRSTGRCKIFSRRKGSHRRFQGSRTG